MSREVQDALFTARLALELDAVKWQRAAADLHKGVLSLLALGNQPKAARHLQEVRAASARFARESHEAWTVLCRERHALDQAVAS